MGGGGRSTLSQITFLKLCNLARFALYFDQILSLKNKYINIDILTASGVRGGGRNILQNWYLSICLQCILFTIHHACLTFKLMDFVLTRLLTGFEPCSLSEIKKKIC